MKTPEGVAAILLAAGRSSRFGGNKLAAALDGIPLVHHSARVLAEIGFDDLIVVSSAATPDLSPFGFRAVAAPAGNTVLSASLAAGIEAAARAGAQAALVALGDMPFVPASHFRALIGAFALHGEPVGTLVSNQSQPPAIFGKAWFERLTALDGDRGAKALLAGCDTIALAAAQARDIDTPADLKP